MHDSTNEKCPKNTILICGFDNEDGSMCKERNCQTHINKTFRRNAVCTCSLVEEWEKSWLVAGELDCDILKNRNGVIYVRQDHMNSTRLSARTEVLAELLEKLPIDLSIKELVDIIKGMMNEK